MTTTAPTPATAPGGALDALTGAVRDAITRRIQSPRRIAVYLAGELARAGHQIGGEQQSVPPAAAVPDQVVDGGGWVCGRPDCALGCRPVSRPVSGPPSVPSLQAAFEARVRPVDGGHLEWTGGYTDQGTPRFKYLDRPYSARSVAFFIRTGVWPTGRVKPECDLPGCVAPVHVDDTATRERTRGTFAALTGYRANGDTCRRGHAYAEHGRWRSNGKRYCHTCQQQRRSAAA